VIVIPEIVSGAEPVFESVAPCVGLVVPITWLPNWLRFKSRSVGPKTGPGEDSLSVELCGLAIVAEGFFHEGYVIAEADAWNLATNVTIRVYTP
jgi:hypothetical protein